MAENPKQRMRRQRLGASASAFGDVKNPIAEEIRDIERYLGHNYQLYPVVPFFGGGDATLYFFQKMRLLSSTHAGIIGSIRDFVLGGEFEVKRKANKRPGFTRRQELEVQVTANEFTEYIDWLESIGLDGQSLIEVVESLYDNLKSYGNAFMEIVWSETDGQPFASFHSHDADQVRYLATTDESRILLISPLWNEDYLRRNPPQFIPHFPEVAEDELGVKRTIIHLKNKVSGYNWYGVPDWIGMLYYGYQEIQLGEYTSVGYANQWTPKVLLQYEGFSGYDEDDDGDGDVYAGRDGEFEAALTEAFTNKGEKKSFILREIEPGGQYANVHEFQLQTNENFHKAMSEIAEGQIFKSHNWHPMLMIATSGKLGLSQELYELIRYKQETVIRRLQNALLGVMNRGIDFLNEQFGLNDQMYQYRLGLSHIFHDMLNAEKQAESQPEPQVEPQEGGTTNE